MKKKKWFHLLKKNLVGLPKKERVRIIDYYDELFLDKYESGMSEWQIIGEFGDPSQAAFKILTEDVSDAKVNKSNFDERLNPYADQVETPRRTPPRPEYAYAQPRASERYEPRPRRYRESEPSVGKIVLTLLLGVIFGGALVGLFTTYWSMIAALFAIAVAVPIGSGILLFTSLSLIASNPWSFVILAGVFILAIAACLLLFAIGIGLAKLGAKLTKGFFGGFARWLQR